MQQEPLFITDITIGDEIHQAKVFGNVDKTTNFIYYTFRLNDGRSIMISQYDGEEWRVDSADNGMNDLALVEQLGKLMNNE